MHFKILDKWIIHVIGTFLKPILVALIERTRGGVPGHQLAGQVHCVSDEKGRALRGEV